MAAIFISHSSRDNAAAARLSERLEARGYGSLFLDFDPELGIPGGRNWEQELYARLRGAQAVLVLCSPAAMASSWVFAEITHARALGKPVIPLRLESCELPSILRDVQIIDFTAWSDEAGDRLWRALVEAGLDPRDPQAWQHDRPPYPGLAAFDEADSAVFFGRDDDIRTGLEVLNRIRRFGGAPLVLFLGPSGSGKSSLVRAGILPRLRRNPGWRVLGTVRPREQALAVLANRLTPDDSTTSSACRRLADGDPAAFAGCLEAFRRDDGAWAVLAVDQLEELFDPDNPAAGGLIELIRQVQAQPALRLVLIGVMRSDFLDDFQSHPQLKSLAFQDVPVRPLAPAEFHRVIAEPARLAGIELEPGLTERMVADTDSEDALPLLAFALRELWENCATTGRISLADYDALDGISGAIRRAADAVLAAARPDAALLEEGLHPAFRRLVRINEAGQYARRVACWDELPERSHALLKRFVAARLLVSGKEEDRLEVAHEALLRVWPLLRGWLDQDREFLLWRRRLQGALDDAALLHDAPLAEAERWYRHRRDDLAAPERDLIEQSLHARDRRQRWKRLATAALALLLILVSLLWFDSERLKESAQASATESRHQLARNHWLSGVDARDDRRDRILAAQHFARSAALYGDTPEGGAALDALAFLGRDNCLLQVVETTAPSRKFALNPELDRLLSWRDAHQASLRDDGGRLLATLPHAGIEGAAFAADGRILSWGGDGGIRLWRPDGEPEGTLRAPPDGSPGDARPVDGALFSPDGRQILSWDPNGTVSLWASDSRERIAHYRHDGAVRRGGFSQDGSTLISWGKDRALYMLRPEDGRPEAPKAHPTAIDRVRLAPSGNRALSVDAVGDVRLWELRSPAPRQRFSEAEGGPFLGAAFLGGESRLLLWNKEGRLQVRDTATGRLRHAFDHGAPLNDLALSAAGDRIATWGRSGAIRVWRADGTPLPRLRHRDAVIGARFSRDGRRLLSWSRDRRARLWDLADGTPIGYAMPHERPPVDARFGPGESRIASWSDGGPVRIWGFGTPAAQRIRLPHSAEILDVRGAAETSELHSLTLDGRVHRWRPDGTSLDGPRALPDFGTFVREARLTADGRHVLGWSHEGLGLWSLADGRAVRRVAVAGLERVLASDDGKALLGWADDGFARVWPAEKSGDAAVRLPHGESVQKAALDAAGRHAATLDYAFEVRLWDLSQPQPVAPPPFARGLANQVAVSTDGRLALAGSDAGELRLLETATGKVLAELDLGVAVGGALFSPDGQRLVAWTDSGLIQQWHSDGSPLGRPMRHQARNSRATLRGVAYGGDGTRLLSWDENGVRVWDSDTGLAVTPRLRHPERIAGARDWGLETPVVLVWGRHGLGLWPLPRPADALAQRQARLTGTELGDSNELGILASERWRALPESAGCRYR